MANRYGEYRDDPRDRQSGMRFGEGRDTGRARPWEDERDEERRRGEEWRREDEPEVTRFGRNLSDDRIGDYGSDDEGRVLYGSRRDRESERGARGWFRRFTGGRHESDEDRGFSGGYGSYAAGSYYRPGERLRRPGSGDWSERNQPYGSDYDSDYGYRRGGYGRDRSFRSFRGRGPKGYERSDERLREVICELLTEDPDIDASEITIMVISGVVTMDGSVDDRQTKYQVEELVENTGGVKDVRNNLRIAPGQPWSGTQGSTQASPQASQGTSQTSMQADLGLRGDKVTSKKTS
jgi:hypothetical protein